MLNKDQRTPKRYRYHIVTEWSVSFYTFLVLLLGGMGMPLLLEKHYWSFGILLFLVALYRYIGFGPLRPIKSWAEYGDKE